MVAEPGSQLGLIELASGKREDEGHDLYLRGLDPETVQAEEEIHGLERGALVSINERMVVGEAKATGRGQRREIFIRIIVESVSGALESRLEEPPITEPRGPAMTLDLIGMDGPDGSLLDHDQILR